MFNKPLGSAKLLDKGENLSTDGGRLGRPLVGGLARIAARGGGAMNRERVSRIAASLLALSLAAGADAQTYDSYSKTMPAGGTLLLAHYASVNGDCSSKGRVEVRVVSGPTSGVIRVAQGSGYGHFTGDYQQCSAYKVFGANVTYTPQKSFLGSDSVQLDVIYPSGLERIETFMITVK
jgi:hypothetical protein